MSRGHPPISQITRPYCKGAQFQNHSIILSQGLSGVVRIPDHDPSHAELAPWDRIEKPMAMIDLNAEIKRAMLAKDQTALTAYRSLKTKAGVKLAEAGREGPMNPPRSLRSCISWRTRSVATSLEYGLLEKQS